MTAQPSSSGSSSTGSRRPNGAIVEMIDVDKDYPLGSHVVHALRNVNLTLEAGEFTTVAGPSGSGKTTLLNLIGCVDVATRGTVRVAGKVTSELSDKKLTDLRLHALGFIFQSFNLISVLDLYQNVEFPLLLQGGLTKGERDKRVRQLVDQVGLSDQMKQRPGELSGGQRQRVAIARALVTKPAIVLADEPTANLDSVTGARIIELMKEINHRDNTTFIFSTHDHRVMEHADRVIELVDGRIVGEGTAIPVSSGGPRHVTSPEPEVGQTPGSVEGESTATEVTEEPEADDDNTSVDGPSDTTDDAAADEDVAEADEHDEDDSDRETVADGEDSGASDDEEDREDSLS